MSAGDCKRQTDDEIARDALLETLRLGIRALNPSASAEVIAAQALLVLGRALVASGLSEKAARVVVNAVRRDG